MSKQVDAVKIRLGRISSFTSRIDWAKWLEMGGGFLLGLLLLAILASIFIGIPVLILAGAVVLLKAGYQFVTTLDQKYYYAAAFLLIFIVVMLFYRRLGLVSLSSQSLAHRRNLFFAFFLVFLIENFNLDVSAMLKAKNPDIDAASKGILSFFALYSFVEYAHNFVFDYLRSKNESRIADNNAFFRRPKPVDPWLIFVGNYRFIFDVFIPIAACVFIVFIYQSDIKVFFNISKTYITEQVNGYLSDPQNGKSREVVDFSMSEYEKSRKHLSEVFEEAEGVSGKVYENIKEEIDKNRRND